MYRLSSPQSYQNQPEDGFHIWNFKTTVVDIPIKFSHTGQLNPTRITRFIPTRAIHYFKRKKSGLTSVRSLVHSAYYYRTTPCYFLLPVKTLASTSKLVAWETEPLEAEAAEGKTVLIRSSKTARMGTGGRRWWTRCKLGTCC
ncbi:hypothetical protein PGT21_019978 [Puccinia graminis f. sp. tritici]|uniref:Uncharacterized protein n=1 Tax=Puccinia graminis f. sp. tritici TaxID=56615 RepID=A0A5B0NG35_PUCGR|nr:hypothetical protein PGT21_019978 [Puccinia graminis f. sp. tritici]